MGTGWIVGLGVVTGGVTVMGVGGHGGSRGVQDVTVPSPSEARAPAS